MRRAYPALRHLQRVADASLFDAICVTRRPSRTQTCNDRSTGLRGPGALVAPVGPGVNDGVERDGWLAAVINFMTHNH
jgi:hypothetical protein